MIFTLDAHIALDGLNACHQRFRELLLAAQRGEYNRAAFEESYHDILCDLYMVDLEPGFKEVIQQLPD